MTEHEPDLSPVSDKLVGAPSAALPKPNKGEPELVVAADPQRAAHHAAGRIAAALIAAVERRGRADFCTTGGSTPIPIYRLLAASPLCDSIPWPQVHFWWGDDRFVPRDHAESNVTALDEVLLGGGGSSGGGSSGGVPLPSANIHPFPTDQALAESRDNQWCAARYAEEMAAHLPLTDGNWPGFDLILVGVGDDGHVLSVFPESPALDSMAWTMGVPAPTHIGPHLPRMTINPRLLEAAPVLVVTWGANKAEAIGHVFGDVRNDRRWPVQRTRRTGAAWIIDEVAAAQIPTNLRG
ncbi:MAG TPA: 6-phosphogluconolactonase [Terriglobales bacterium]|nr:6-phosphogluconolactonase [Terriglobales bacterium]